MGLGITILDSIDLNISCVPESPIGQPWSEGPAQVTPSRGTRTQLLGHEAGTAAPVLQQPRPQRHGNAKGMRGECRESWGNTGARTAALLWGSGP